MKERPILFSAPMVRAILDGRKTQTRRVVKPQPIANQSGWWSNDGKEWCGSIELWAEERPYRSTAYAHVEDKLWVRETFCPIYPQDPNYNGGRPIAYDYAASYQHGNRLGDLIGVTKKWKPSIHMPRIASRILLEVTGVRIDRLNNISEADAQAEGCGHSVDYTTARTYAAEYQDLWESINGPASWADNPWVWVIEFKRVQP